MFIVIEGIEGAGKSSVQAGLGKSLISSGREVLLTREPGGTKLGEKIRELLLSSKGEKISAHTELLLFAADRAEHVRSVIRPALEDNKIVICDRFIYSTLAYQGFGRGIELALIETLNSIATYGLTPDLVLLLDLPVETGLARARSRAELESADSWTRFEKEEFDFHQRLREGFLQLAKQNSTIFEIIDASVTPDKVLQMAVEATNKKMGA